MMNERMFALRIGALAVAPLIAALAISGCSRGGGGSSSSGQPSLGSLDIISSAVSGEVGSSFDFSVRDPDASLSYRWVFGNGLSLSGDTVNATFSAAGIIEVDVTAEDQQLTAVAIGATIVTVFDGTGQDLFGNPYPDLLGDVDQDGRLTLADAQALRQALSGLQPLTDDIARDAADMDLDGALTDLDSRLLGMALIGGTSTPRALDKDSVFPGQVLTVYSPSLDDPNAQVSLRFDGFDAFVSPRIVLGQASIFVPLDVLTPGSDTLLEGDVNLELLVDGVISDGFPVHILAAPPIDSSNPLGLAKEVLSNLAPARQVLCDSLVELAQRDTLASLGYESTDLMALAQAVQALSDGATAQESLILQQLDSLDSQSKVAMARVAAVNGFDELRDSLDELFLTTASLGLGGSSPFTSSDFDILCAFSLAASILESSGTASGYLCTALTLAAAGCFIFPVCEVPALVAAASACITYSSFIEAASTLLSLVPVLKDGLELSLSTDPSSMPTVSTVTANVTLLIPICGLSSSGLFLKKLQKNLAIRILKSGPVFPFFKLAKALGQTTTNAIVKLVDNAIGSLVSGFGIDDLLTEFYNTICASLGVGELFSVDIDGSSLFVTLTPNVGSYSVNAQGQLEFVCPIPDPQDPVASVQLDAVLPTCFGDQEGSISIPCLGVVDVPLTIGDNGSLTDDIFEAAIDGQVVLTMNQPLVGTSTVVQLAPGEHVLDMRGLAAPDGIGTYYVTVSGGSTLTGPGGCGSGCTFATGSDLTAGTVLSWTLTVPDAGN